MARPLTPRSGPARSPWRARARRALRWTLIVLGGYYLAALVMLVAYRFVMPPTTGVQIERRIGALLSRQSPALRKRPIPLASLPRHVPRAVVAAEDGRFYTHNGFDWVEMKEAGERALGGGRRRGASTITQQLMKNLFGCTCRNPIRKFYDLALTPPAELILGKQRILEIYLNQVEWGPSVFGVEAAAQHHYGKRARSLSVTQAAGLAALLPNPRRRTPATTPQYRAEILRRMRVRGWL